ncbi:MAG: sialic acid TRAP transporter substrate-binding protein SiaP [Treponemataceae bacterium]
MKRVAIIGLSVFLCASTFVFAGGGTETVKPVNYKIAHVYQPDHPFSAGMKQLGAMVSEKTGGKFTITEFPAGQLGSEKDLSDGLVNGVLEMAIIGPGEIGKRYKPVLIFDGPFIFRDFSHAEKVLSGDIGKELWGGLEKQTGLMNLTTLYYGTRYVTSKKAIKTPEDMKGMKLRAPDMPLSVANAKAMGANPTPMALAEVYLALQQNVVDGQENPIPTIYTQKFYEVQSHISLTGHVLQLTPVFISKKKFDALPAAYQKALLESIAAVAPTINKAVADAESKWLGEMKAKGMQVVQPDVEAFRVATQPVIKQFEGQWGAGLYERIQAVK